MTATSSQRFYYNDSDYLNYEVIGKSGRPIVFLHGFAASLENWKILTGSLPAREYQIFLIDLKGFGLSAKPRDGKYSMQDNADLIAQFIRAQKLKDYVLAGHSFGGGVALLVAIASIDGLLDRPKKLILFDAAAYNSEIPFFVRYLRIPVLRYVLTDFSPASFQARYTLTRIVYDKSKITEALVERYAVPMRTRGYNYALLQTAAQIIPNDSEQIVSRYHSIDIPTLIIWGRDDAVIPLSSGERLAKELPNATLHVIDECGHNSFEECSADAARVIAKFCSAQGGIE